ncbi:MAG: TonB-dependent receptor [Bryobacterales bacterium]|nr:TonB-dependent receptor [Bryobacterales bacterium]
MKIRRAFRMMMLLTLLTPGANAQNAEIAGRVVDPSGAVIPQADIMVVNTETGTARKTASNDEGYYAVPLLQPGRYRLTAQKSGFKPVARDGIVLQVGDRLTMNVAMEIGTAAEHVTVSGELPLLRTEDVQSGLVIDNKRIQDLPQYRRNALAFALLAPNVNGTSEQAGHDTDLRINGGRTSQAEYYIDGVPVTNGYNHNVPPSVPSRESIGEFKVITNGLSAEYGHLSGGAVVLVTRSGTNAFHGSLYEFFRNDKLNANDWNSNRFGRSKGTFHDNVFGGTFAGPVLIPKLYNGRDKTFFFFNYEGTRHVTGSNAKLGGVPTDLERQGDFSQSLIDGGKPVQIFDPATGRASGGDVIRQPFPGNRIPASRINPISKIYLGFYPQPNQTPRAGSSHDLNYIGSAATPSNNDVFTGRLDQNWSAEHSTQFAVTRYGSNSSSPGWLAPLQASSVANSEAYTTSLGHNIIMSPTMMMNLRMGVVWLASVSGSAVVADAGSWGFQPQVCGMLGTTKNRVPSLVAQDDTLTTLGGGGVSNEYDTNYFGSVSVQKLWGRQTLKFGYEHRRYYSNTPAGGTFFMSTTRNVVSQSYNNPVTGSGLAAWELGAVTNGNGTQLAGPASLQTYHGAFVQDDIKLTRKFTVNLGLRWDFEPPRTERYDRQIFWDNNYKWPWQPNAGWNWAQATQEAGLPASAPQPEWLTKGIFGRVAMLGSSDYSGRHTTNEYRNHFGPRLGVAYEILPRTVLRAGYGMVWLSSIGSVFMNGAPWNIGYGDFAHLPQPGTPDGGVTFPASFSTPMPGGAGYVPFTHNTDELNLSTMGLWWISNNPLFSPGYEHVAQLGIQRQIGTGEKAWVVEVNYNGNLGRGLPFAEGGGLHILPNAYHILSPLGATALNTQVTNPFYGQVPANTNTGGPTIPLGRLYQTNPLWSEIWSMNPPEGTSNYHAGYVQVEHRFGHGFTFLANYTISKLLQDVGGLDYGQFTQGYAGQGAPQAGLGMSDIYGLAPTDISQKLLFNYLFEVPVGHGKRLLGNPQTSTSKGFEKVVGGWQMAGVTTYRTGQPLVIHCLYPQCFQWYNIGQSRGSRPVFVTPTVAYDNHVSGHTALEGAPGYQPYFNPASFRITQGMEIGNVPGTLPNMRGPGFSQWDFSLLKNIGLGGEVRRLQLRFEAQNLFNHMNAAAPNGTVGARTFGMITAQTGNPRQVMIAAKLYF